MSKIGLAFSVPDEQRIKYKVTPLPGQVMSLEAIGGQMVALAKLLKANAKEADPGTKWNTFILGISTFESGEIEFEVLIAPKSGTSRAKVDDPPADMQTDSSG